MAGYVVTMHLREGLTEGERQRRLRAAFDVLLAPTGKDAGRAHGVETQTDPRRDKQPEGENGHENRADHL